MLQGRAQSQIERGYTIEELRPVPASSVHCIWGDEKKHFGRDKTQRRGRMKREREINGISLGESTQLGPGRGTTA